MRSIQVLFMISLLLYAMACTQKQEDKKSSGTEEADSSLSCKNPYADNMKPMAQDMRAMYEQMVIIRARIEKGQDPEAGSFKMIDFINSEPTDSSVLTDEFFMLAGRFKRNFNDMAASGNTDIKERFNTVVGSCVNCHVGACPGPLKKIRKLSFGSEVNS